MPLGKFRQLNDRYAERLRDPLDRAPRWVGVATLDGRDGAGRHAGRVGKVLLAEAALVAELADRLAEGGLGVWLASHSQLQTADS